ncbi:amino acid ABC transporter ATP-binding protein [Leucobacter chinensis]|uniref:amino acid ABC transporter ATP-binding protein n=1 Tax=Leucobacter chinensis TaxID=2851010 RepID=UPI001C2238AA|nr:amino acid ABC transporter ATP-binding protein [Leucobacter chinensis]
MTIDWQTPLVEMNNIHVSFGENHVLRGVNLDVHEGEVLCLIGASGSGKSTLLRTINALQPLDKGYVSVDGRLVGATEDRGRLYEATDKELAASRRHIGMVFQHFNLFPHLKVVDNVTIGLKKVLRVSGSDAKKKALRYLERVGLSNRANHYPSQLSGGQQQRVAIARALAMEPKLMLFDELTSALDPELVGEVLHVMREIAEEGMTMIVVTHEMHFAQHVADRIAFMRDGVIEELGEATRMIAEPQSPHLQQFLSHLSS